MELIKKLEQYVFYFLVTMLFCYILVEIIELVHLFIQSILTRGTDNRWLLSSDQVKEILPVFFNILIAVELIDTFNVYIKENSIKVQNILLIGLIAIGRKVISYDFAHADALANMGLAVLVIAFAGSYFLIKKSDTFNQK
ncbi:MAG: hypothetical protein EAZ16_04010 [Sphingobacteriales bacterium]|jgi:uncharacterized membrane protein (DUF373 family)|nr:MAG: hypothetical protein EAZ16_04010 [Sphingobacteriales bacterium]